MYANLCNYFQQTPADTVSITSGEEDGEDDQLSEVKSKTQLPLIEDSLVWDGHTYQLMKGDKTRSLWLCKSGPGHCSGKVVLDKGEVVVTGEHCHQPQLGIYVQVWTCDCRCFLKLVFFMVLAHGSLGQN